MLLQTGCAAWLVIVRDEGCRVSQQYLSCEDKAVLLIIIVEIYCRLVTNILQEAIVKLCVVTLRNMGYMYTNSSV